MQRQQLIDYIKISIEKKREEHVKYYFYLAMKWLIVVFISMLFYIFFLEYFLIIFLCLTLLIVAFAFLYHIFKK